MGEESLVARLREGASYIDSVTKHGNFAYSGKSDAALLREAADAFADAHDFPTGSLPVHANETPVRVTSPERGGEIILQINGAPGRT